MKPLRANPALGLCLASVLLCGCPGKKPVAAATPPAPAPAAAPEPTPAPPETQAQNQESQPATQGTPPPDTSQQPAEKAEQAKPKTGKAHTAAKKPAPTQGTAKNQETARNTTPRIIIKPDGSDATSASGTISPGPAPAEPSRNQATTEQLLQGAESTLNNLKRQLSKEEEAIVLQIRDFAKESRKATDENDLTRAHTLALKAYLLSDDLAKRR